MQMDEILGRTLTNIYSYSVPESESDDELNVVWTYLELDGELIIMIPWGRAAVAGMIRTETLPEYATSILEDVSDIPEYHIDNHGYTVHEVAANYQRRSRQLYYRLRKFFLGLDPPILGYSIEKITYHENKCKYLRNRKIIDYIWYPEHEEWEAGWFLLENGYLISDICVAPRGVGVGLQICMNTDDWSKPFQKWTQRGSK